MNRPKSIARGKPTIENPIAKSIPTQKATVA